MDVSVSSRTRAKCGVHCPVGIQPDDEIGREAIEGGKITGDNNLPIRLQGQRSGRIIRAGAGIEGGINGAIDV